MAKFGPWRKIPQWLAGIVFVASLAAALAIRGLVGLSAPETAKPILADVFKGALLHTEAGENFAQIQPFVKTLPPDQNLSLPGFPELSITTGEAATLSRDQLAGRIAGELADKSYEQGLKLPAQSGVNTATVEPLGAIFSADSHQSISNLHTSLWALAILMAAIMVIFSSRFGRLAALGFGLVAGSAPPAAVYSVLPARLKAIGDSAGGASKELQMLAPILELIKPALEAARDAALKALLLGVALLFLALVGGLIARVRPAGADDPP